MRVLSNFCFKKPYEIQNSSALETINIILLLTFNKGSLIKYWRPLMNSFSQPSFQFCSIVNCIFENSRLKELLQLSSPLSFLPL